MVGKRCKRTFLKHSYCSFCAYPSMGYISAMGLGHKRQRAGTILSETFWIGLRFKWTYSSNHSEDRRQYHFSHCNINSIPAAATWHGSGGRSNESSGGTTSELIRHNNCELCRT